MATTPRAPRRDDVAATLQAAALALVRYGTIPASVRDEIAQEAGLRTLAAPGVHNPRAFARRTARNLAINWLRRLRYEQPLVGDGPTINDWARVDAQIDLERAWRALRRGPPAHLAILDALYLEGEDVESVVRRTVGPGTAAASPGWTRARDTTYKRHKRALRWTRRALGG